PGVFRQCEERERHQLSLATDLCQQGASQREQFALVDREAHATDGPRESRSVVESTKMEGVELRSPSGESRSKEEVRAFGNPPIPPALGFVLSATGDRAAV
ncbi:hypothetical protein ACTGVI_12510, partial [Streptococcus suis]